MPIQVTAILVLVAAFASGFLTHRYDAARYEKAVADQQREAAEMLRDSAVEHGKQVAENDLLTKQMEADYELSTRQIGEVYDSNRALAARLADAVRLRVSDRKGCKGGLSAAAPDPEDGLGVQAMSGLLDLGDQTIAGAIQLLPEHDRRGDRADAVATTCQKWAIEQEKQYAERGKR
jgi:hypothetical protein